MRLPKTTNMMYARRLPQCMCVEILLLDAKMEACNHNSKQEVVANSKPGSQTGRDLSFKLGITTKYDLKIDNGGLYEFLSEDQHSV